jgi:hypothetical protein
MHDLHVCAVMCFGLSSDKMLNDVLWIVFPLSTLLGFFLPVALLFACSL